MKKNFIKCILLFACLFSLSACSDFFNTSTSDALSSDSYIDEESEMYSGYIGIITKVQAIGDKAIYLTDTRGELLEPTINTPSDLYDIYSYKEDLSGNSYADPSPYYDVIIACNDYLENIHEYKEADSVSIDEDHYEALVSSTLRVKAWTYLTLAKIYGQAIWFDDPLTSLEDISDYEVSDLDAIVTKCLELLNTGYDGVDGSLSFSWVEWVDPDNVDSDGPYRYWDYMTPDYATLYAELSLWAGDYQTTVDLILDKLNASFLDYAETCAVKETGGTGAVAWMRNAFNAGKWGVYWDRTEPYAYEAVSVILYDYENGQTNSLLDHFESESPNEYLLAPSEIGRERFYDTDFDPLGNLDADPRAGKTFAKDDNGDYEITKFRSLTDPARDNAYQDDVHIYIYRAAELYFMLAEALNNLGRFEPAEALINSGVSAAYSTTDSEWDGFTADWTANTSTGYGGKYPDLGIRGSLDLSARTFSDTDKEANDMQILDEMMLECACEGKIYPAMIRMAKRYGDYNIIADRVCPKYGADSTSIRSKILDGGYFVNWDLK